jgi:RNA polymerase sigma-70 factor (ECF subfamily)
MAPPAQSMPSVMVQLAAPVGGELHVPYSAPVLLVQAPPQHSAPVAHTSPFWMHHEEAAHEPLKQSPEQQPALVAQGLLRVLHVVLSGTHVPPEQSPLQQEALEVHIWSSAMHAGRLQTPPVHAPEQHSNAVVHAPPTWRQVTPPSPPKPAPVLPPVLVAPLGRAPPWPPELDVELPLEELQPATSTLPAETARATRRKARMRSRIGGPFEAGEAAGTRARRLTPWLTNRRAPRRRRIALSDEMPLSPRPRDRYLRRRRFVSHPLQRSALLMPDAMRPSSRPAVPLLDAERNVVRSLPSVRDDAALLEGLRAGESWAKAALFERYAPHVQRLLRKILGPQPSLELPDLIHDVFVRALASIDQLREPGAMLAWMQAITTRLAYRALQAQRARRWLRFWEPIELAELSSPRVDTEVLDAYRRTYAVLERMPLHERIVFALRYIDGMELSPIAVACEVSLATVKRRLARAEQRFATAARRDEILRTWLEEGNRWAT